MSNTADLTSMALRSLTNKSFSKKTVKADNIRTFTDDNHVLHFYHLRPYMIQDILDLLKHCKIDDWTIDNDEKNTILSFRPEIKSTVDQFYDNLTGYKIKYNKLTVS